MIKPFLIISIGVAFSVFPFDLQGQGNRNPPSKSREFKFEHFALKEGLPSLNVSGALQDSQGFMWFATLNGLTRYDGYRFKTFHNDPDDPHSINTESLRTLYEDRAGVLWIGTSSSGLNAFNRATEEFSHYQHNPDNPHSLSHNRIHAIYEDQSNRLWIGTKKGLNRFERASGQFIHYYHDPKDDDSLSHNQVMAIAEDTTGQLWLGTERGLNKFDPTNGKFIRYQHDSSQPNSLQDNNVQALAIDMTGSLWVGTQGGLDRFDPKTEQFSHYSHNPNDPQSLNDNDVRALYTDHSGEVWVGTVAGLNLFDPKTKTFQHYKNDPSNPDSFRGEWVSFIYADQTDALWFTILGGGINRLDRGAAKFELYRHNPNDPHTLSQGAIRSIFQDRLGSLWVGTLGGGLNKYDSITGRFSHYQNDPDNPYSLNYDQVFAITEDPTGALWIGTRKGLDRFERESEQFIHYTHDPNDLTSLSASWVSTLHIDRRGRLWVGTLSGGLSIFDPDTDRFRHYQADPTQPNSLSDNRVLTIAEDQSGKLWIGTFGGGLNQFDPEAKTFHRYRHEPDNINSLGSNEVIQIYIDQAGVLWLATTGGLDKFDPQTETFTHYREKNGLANKNVVSVVDDLAGGLWLGTRNGLSRFDPGSETFQNYDQNDGLQGNEFLPRVAYRGIDGKLYFGGNYGLNAFYPTQLKDNSYLPPVVLTDFRIFNQSASPGDKDSPLQRVINETKNLMLSYQQSVFSFEFAALNYRAPEKNQYAYQLEGFDRAWNYTDSSRRFATYTNLNPGIYTFRVKASNNDGAWNDAGKVIKITIPPPWWQTWWAYSLSILIAGGVVIGLIWLFTQAQAKELARISTLLKLHQSEETLGENRQLLQSILDNSAAVIQVKDLEGRYVLVNQQFERLHGLDSREIIGNPPHDFLPKEIADHFVAEDQKVLEAREARQSEDVIFIRGEIRTYLAVKFPLFNAKGSIYATAGIATDITERKRAEEALLGSEEKYRALFEQSRDAIYITSQEGRFIDVNPFALEMFGYTQEEMMGLDAREIFFHPADRDKYQQEVEQKGFVKDYEVKHRKKDGTAMDCLLTATVRRDKEGTILGYQGIIRDITEYKNLEVQFRQAQKMESMGILAGGIAHEFNNLLTPIMGYSQMLLSKPFERSLEKNYLAQIFQAGERATTLVKQILAFSRKSMAERTSVQLEEIVKEALKLLEYTLPATISIQQEIDSDLPPVRASSLEIHQIITNLIVNASHAMPEVGVLKISVKKGIPRQNKKFFGKLIEGPFVMLSVRDTGCGMGQSMVDHIFEPFYTTKEVGKGTGLGLSVVLGIVEQHSGYISVESIVGKGTQFDICLPAITVEEETTSESVIHSQLYGNERVLLIDDEPMIRDLLSEMLKKLGYQVTSFTDCNEILKTFREHPQDFDLLVTDYTMPKMTGKTLSGKLKEIRPDIPVILLTGYSESVTEENVESWGIAALLMKPVQVEKLSQVIRKVLDQTKS